MHGPSKKVYTFDILLVMPFFRQSGPLLSICKELGSKCSIGLLPLTLDNTQQAKHRKSNKLFITLLEQFGARVVRSSDSIDCKTVLFVQYPYSTKQIEMLNHSIQAQRRIGMLTLAWPGLHNDFIEKLDIEILFTVHRRFMDFLLKKRGQESRYKKCDIYEVGLPYGKYPVFEKIQADYFLVMPTPFSFPKETDKLHFLYTLISVLSKLDGDDKVFIKIHNATDRDSFSNNTMRKIASTLKGLNIDALQKIKMSSSVQGITRYFQQKLEQLKTAVFYESIMDRVLPFEEYTPHNYIPYEAFLPGIKKGVIGGLSNTIWGALFFRLPFYNCVDINRQDRRPERTIYKKDPTNLLDLNLQFFGVPYCNGNLHFDFSFFDIIEDTTRTGDIVAQLKCEFENS